MLNELDVPQVREYILYRLSQLSPAQLRGFEKILDVLYELREEGKP